MRIFALLSVLLLPAACGGGGKYGEVKETLNDQMDAMEDLVAAAAQPDNAKGIIVAMEKMAAAGAAGQEKMAALAEKYPELADQANPPEELKAEMARMEKIVPEFMGAMMKVIEKYGENPEVQAAMQKMQPPRGK